MAADDKKAALAILVGKPSDEKMDDDSEAKMPPLEDVMSEFIAAVKAGDAKAAAKAFKAAKACSDEPDEDDAE